jgi:hypothetical protein
MFVHLNNAFMDGSPPGDVWRSMLISRAVENCHACAPRQSRVTATIYAGLTDAARAGLGAKLSEAFGA